MSLRGSNITFKYFENAPSNTLDHVSINVPKGKITILIGKSGSGKSTLAYILAGLYPENCGFLLNGEVMWDDVDILSLKPSKRVAYVAKMFQNPDLQFCMNNLRNELSFCLENVGAPVPERGTAIEEAACAAGVLHLLDRDFNKMSGGEKQKCALCCILALGSKCIILDEAFANVDTGSAKQIIALFKEMGLTILAVDHNVALWEGAYDHLESLDGTTYKTFESRRELHAAGEVVVSAKGLSVNGIRYPDMEFRKGSLTAIVGKSGSGKTTLFRTLMKQLKYEGEVDFFGRSLRRLTRRHVFSKCGIVFQNPSNQFLALNCFDEVYFSIKRWHKNLDDGQKLQKAVELLKTFELGAFKKRSPYLLSQGQQRRLAVLSMIAGQQELLLLDEPTYGQDYENICAIMELLMEKTKDGLTVVYSTHNDRLARYFSHQVIKLGGERFE